MITSGTVGQKNLTAIELIEHAARRCGVLATVLTGEMVQSAKDNLSLVLSDLATKGLQLWAVNTTVYPLRYGQRILELDVGTVDIQSAQLRSTVPYSQTSLGPSPGVANTATFDSVTGVTVGCASATVAAADEVNLVLEGSADGISWVQYGARTIKPAEAGEYVFDAVLVATLRYWRVRETGGLIPLLAARFFTDLNDIDMSQLNRDDYTSMPNKDFLSTQPLQYFYDKQFYKPRMVFWPVPGDESRLCVVSAQFQIQDVGDLSNNIQVPQRWVNAVISALAPYVCLELPKELVPPDRYDILVNRAEAALATAQDAEVDGSPVKLSPRIGGYTNS